MIAWITIINIILLPTHFIQLLKHQTRLAYQITFLNFHINITDQICILIDIAWSRIKNKLILILMPDIAVHTDLYQIKFIFKLKIRLDVLDVIVS